jgi:hypothetical protein
VGLVNEDGTPVKPEAQADGDGGTAVEAAPDVVAEVRVSLKNDGNIRVDGPGDFRLVLRMLHEAADIVLTKLAVSQTMGMFAQAQRGIAKPGLSDVLALARK